MGFRFRKSIKVLPGIKVNIGKTGIGVSAGVKGAHIGVNKRGTYTDVGIPGTGISSFNYLDKGKHQVSQSTNKPNTHLFWKILFFPIWIEFYIAFYLFKILFEIVVFIISKLVKKSNVNLTNPNPISTTIIPDQSEQISTTLSPIQHEQTIKTCTGQLMSKDSQEVLEKHYKQMLEYNMRNYKGYIESGVVKGKSWDANKNGKIDPDACEVCINNVNVGSIPLQATFPSGHLYPPAGQLCRCNLQPDVED